MRLRGAHWGLSGGHLGSAGLRSFRFSWGLLGLSVGHLGSVGFSGAQCAMYVHPTSSLFVVNNTVIVLRRIEVTLWHGCSSVNLLLIFWTPFPRNTSGGLRLS